MTNDEIESIIEGFHYGTDGGLPVDCCDDEATRSAFDAWARKEHAELYEDAGELEPFLIDEEGIEVIAQFFTTLPKESLPKLFKELRKSIVEFYGDGPDPQSDDSQEAIAAATIKEIDVLVG